jgi:hypothetical protein
MQIKTTRVWNKSGKSRNRQFKFQGTSKYPGCLMFCCALLENETLCWLIPGNALTKVKSLTVTDSLIRLAPALPALEWWSPL